MTITNTLGFLWSHPLSRGQFATTLSRFVKWQIVSRLFPEAGFMIPWLKGTRLIAHRGETGVTGNVYCGLHDFQEMAFVLHLLRDTDLFLDAGANSGVYTILACGAAGAEGIAVEPVPTTFERLSSQILINGLGDRVTTHQAGLGAQSGSMQFTTGFDTVNRALAPGEDAASSTIRVPVKTVDEICEDRAPTLIKIDVEGFEKFVLEGATRVLRAPELKAVIMEVNGSGEIYGSSDRMLLELMSQMNFATKEYDPWSRKLKPHVASNRCEGNLIFVRDESWVEARCSTSPRFSIGPHQF